MANLPIHWIVARAFVHATEEESRVLAAVEAVLPSGETERDEMEGQRGYPIVQVARRAQDPAAIRAVWDAWRRAGVLTALQGRSNERVDEEGILHVRISKQEAFLGRLVLAGGADGDLVDVQIKVSAYPAKPEVARRVAKTLVAGGA